VRVSSELVRDLNTLSAFLALEDIPELNAPRLTSACGEASVDGIVLLGNSVLVTAERAFRAAQQGLTRFLVISGGVGHSTPYLRDAIARHPRYGTVKIAERSEAEILGQLAIELERLDPSRVILETTSQNCGENALHTRRELDRLDLALRTMVLVQDPTMQRRTDASFRRAFADSPHTVFLNCPTFVPRVTLTEGELRFAGPERQGPWAMERFLALVMGEIPRLRDDEDGYGPRGKGFIAHVDVPEQVLTAHARLEEVLGPGARGFPSRSD
jgi:uncharacterized SAM-binding protein YcdF (DUF218 family)